MKLNQLLLVGAAAFASTAAFAADVTVRFTGSTAFRSATMTAIDQYFTGAPDLRIVANKSSLNSAEHATFMGTVGGKTVLVQCSWSGAMEGVRVVADVTNPLVDNFLTEASLAADGSIGGSAHATIALTNNVESAVADVAMGDSTQAETGFIGAGYNTLTESTVGVIPFVWMKGRSKDTTKQAALNSITNITNLQIQAILYGGCPLSMFTKSQADLGTTVYVVGRDVGSGTRLDTFLESGYGRDTNPEQFKHTIADGEITSLVTANGSGWDSGSKLRTAVSTETSLNLTVNGTAASGVIFAYMGIADAAAITGAPFENTTGTFMGPLAHQVLSYNGVPYSHDAVRNGAYPFWNYQVLMHKAGLSGDKLTAVNTIKTKIIEYGAAIGGIKLDSMNVTRAGSGQAILSTL